MAETKPFKKFPELQSDAEFYCDSKGQKIIGGLVSHIFCYGPDKFSKVSKVCPK